MRWTTDSGAQDSRPSVTPERASVVQLETATAADARLLAGRVEHVPTGEAARFRSVGELARFMKGFLGGESRSGVGVTRRSEGRIETNKKESP
jgi:hypothetical protein